MRVVTACLTVLMLALTSGVASAQKAPEVPQDPVVLEFATRALPYYPASSFAIRKDERFMTASGAYRIVEVQRECASQFLSGISTLVVDEPGKAIWVASVGELPLGETNASATAVRNFVSDFLPKAMEQNMRIRSTVDWDVERSGSSALVPFELVIQSGYGTYRRPGAVSLTGGHVLIGARYPMGEDPVAFRRELFRSSDAVIWDHGEAEAKVTIVEFSDLQCPACRVKWPLIKGAMGKHQGAVEHGMVHFPLPAIHPWAFRAASGAWCVADQNTALQSQFKETFYNLQQVMETDLVTDTARDYVASNGLDEAAFDACYLKPASIDAIHGQMNLGNRLGINSTPTYFVNGWEVRAPDASWFMAMIDNMVETGEP